MPLVILFAALLFVMAMSILVLPFSVVARYRAGTSRRMGRGWLLSVNLYGVALSAVLFLTIAAVSSFWIPDAFVYGVAGVAAGSLLGVLGLILTRWEITPQSIHFTPSRWLILSITLIVAARILYGFWRGWQAWRSPSAESWLEASGAAGSVAAGGVVLGYYLVYWFGVRRRVREHARLTRRSR